MSTLLSQEVGSAWYYVRLIADNIQVLQDLAAQLNGSAEVINILRGTTAVISSGEILADVDNSYIAVSPQTGTADDLTTIDGNPDGRIIVLRSLDPSHEITVKAIQPKAISSTNPFLDEFTSAGHGLLLGELIGMGGPGLPADVVPGAYYAVPTGADTFKIATSKDNALAMTVVDIANTGTGFLQIGNIAIESDIKLTGNDTLTLVQDGPTYKLLATSAAMPSTQPISDILTELSQLVISGSAGHFIQINATGDGFEVIDYGLDQLQADLLAKAAVEHTHTFDEIPGLQDALDAAAASGPGADLTDYYTKEETDAAIADAGVGGGGTPLSTNLANLDAEGNTANKVPYQLGTNNWALASLTAFGRSLIGSADGAAAAALIGSGGTSTFDVNSLHVEFPVGENTFCIVGGHGTLASHGTLSLSYGVTFAVPPVCLVSGGDGSTSSQGQIRISGNGTTADIPILNAGPNTGTYHWIAFGKLP